MSFKFTILTVCATFCFFSIQAQDLKKSVSAGFAVEGGITEGKSTTLYSGALGLTTWLSFHVGHGFLTAGTGFMGFLSADPQLKGSSSGLQVPILAGYKYIFLHQHLFVKMEGGMSRFDCYYKFDEFAPVRSWGLTLDPSIGYQFNPLEFSLKYEVFHSAGLVINFYALHLGFNF